MNPLLKGYNAIEILLLQSIQLAFYPEFVDPLAGKKESEKIQKEVKDFLKNNKCSIDKRNNRHIIQFLRQKSAKVNSFLSQLVRIDVKTNWEAFFELISLLRNIIAHHGMIVTLDVQNEINSRASDLFNRNFDIVSDGVGNQTLKFKDIHRFQSFIDYFNDFTLNTAKFIFDQPDLSFMDLQ